MTNEKNKELRLSGFEECLHGAFDQGNVGDFEYFLKEKKANPYYAKDGKDIVSKISDLEYKEEKALHKAVDGKNTKAFIEAINNGANYTYEQEGLNVAEKLMNMRMYGNYYDQAFAFNMYSRIDHRKIRQTDSNKLAKQMAGILTENELERTDSIFKGGMPPKKVKGTIKPEETKTVDVVPMNISSGQIEQSGRTSRASNTDSLVFPTSSESKNSQRSHGDRILQKRQLDQSRTMSL